MKDAIGKPLDRVDGRLKVTGKATYAVETAVANVAHAVIVGSTIAKGKIASIDVAAAKAAPGVLSVITHLDAPKLPGLKKQRNPQARILQLLQSDEVLYHEHPIALVVAETLEAAQHGARLVNVKYEEGKPVTRIEDSADSSFVPKTMPGRPGADASRGDFEKAFSSAPVKVDAEYVTPTEHHNPMELHGTLAVWQGNDHVTIYNATQGITGDQGRIADLFDIPKENVRVICKFVGGGFGCKGSSWSHVGLAALGAKVTGRPVKLMLTRHQMFGFVGNRPETRQHLSLGAEKDGKLVAVRHDSLSYTSRFDDFHEPAANTGRMLYASPNMSSKHRCVRLDVPTPTFMRAPGESSGSFGIESAMDELAYALAMDPIALRVKNHADKDPAEDKPWSSKSLLECYKRAAEKFGWAKRKAQPRSMRDGKWLVGYGMATATYPANQWKSGALVRILADGTAVVLSGTHDLGTGQYTVMTQVAAELLGLPVEKVKFDLGDTTFPEAPVAGGSNSASSVGSAIKSACDKVIASLAKIAVADAKSPLHGAAAEDVIAEDGGLVSSKDKSKREAYGPILERAGKKEIEEKVVEDPFADRKKFSTHGFGAQLVEVKVDEDLGVVRVSRVTSAFACGRILNAKTARSQYIGGIVWGIGMALHEHTVRDDRNARVVTRDLADYHVPVNADVPLIDVIMVEETDLHVNPIGTKGIGEIGITGVAAAVANAVYHATGKRVRDLPLTLDKVLG